LTGGVSFPSGEASPTTGALIYSGGGFAGGAPNYLLDFGSAGIQAKAAEARLPSFQVAPGGTVAGATALLGVANDANGNAILRVDPVTGQTITNGTMVIQPYQSGTSSAKVQVRDRNAATQVEVGPGYLEAVNKLGVGTNAPSGTLDVEGGTAMAAADGAPVIIKAQDAGSSNRNGGNVTITAGSATGAGAPGTISLKSPVSFPGGGDASTLSVTPNGGSPTPLATALQNLPHYAASNAELRSLSPGLFGQVIRQGFTASGDAPPMVFLWQATCPATPDNAGYLVAPTKGGAGCWQAEYGPEGLDPREFGAAMNGTSTDPTNDTAAFTAIDRICSIMGASNFPAVRVTGTAAVKNLYLSCIPKIVAAVPGAGFALANGASTSDNVLWYHGSGPFIFDGLSISCPIYNYSNLDSKHLPVAPAGRNALLVEPGSPNTQMESVTITNNAVTGCQTGIQVQQAVNVVITNNFNDRQWANAIVVAGETGDPTVNSGRWMINFNRAVMPGGYAVSVLANSSSSVNQPGSKVQEIGNIGIGCGFIQGKFCRDVTAHNWRNVEYDNTDYDAMVGGVEFKRGQGTSISANIIPNDQSGLRARVFYTTSMDAGTCAAVLTEEGVDTAPGLHRNAYLDATCIYQQPVPWQAGVAYNVGDVRSANGNLYQVWQKGTSDPQGSGPSGIGFGPISEGGVVWVYRYPLPTYQYPTDATPSGGITGSGYVVGDILTLSSGCVLSPQLTVTAVDMGGQVLRARISKVGMCISPPTSPIATTGGTGTGAQFNVNWAYTSAGLAGAYVEASSGVEIHLHVIGFAIGAYLSPRGGSDQTIRGLNLYLDGATTQYCLRDVASYTFGVQSGYVEDAKLFLNCRNLGQVSNAGAVSLLNRQAIPAWAASTGYYQNDLVTSNGKVYMAQCSKAYAACTSGSSGPAGTGNAIGDGSDNLTWANSGQTYATITYTNLQFIGGVIENQGRGYAFWAQPSGAIVSGLMDGTTWIGGDGGLYVAGSANMNIYGGSITVNSSAPNASPITLDNASGTANGTLTLMGHVVATTTKPITSSQFAGVSMLLSPTGKVNGTLDRGVISSDPSGQRACSRQDLYYIDVPTATVPNGWRCTTESATPAASAFTKW
jgi:hypothetical protein